MRKIVFKTNRNMSILTIATGIFVALPAVCFPIGLRDTATPAMVVSRANAMVNGTSNVETGGVEIEEWALVSSTDELKSAETDDIAFLQPVENTDDPEVTNYSDVDKFVIYQQYDDSNLPIELLDPQCFAPDDTTYYVRASQSILKEEPDMESLTLVSLHVGQEVTRTGVGDTWSRIKVTDKKNNEYEGYVLTNTIQDTMISVSVDRTVWVDTDSLIVRSQPSTSSEQVTIVNDEDKLYCSAIVGDKWYKVKTTGGKEGYVYMSYTTTNPPPTPTPTPTPKPKPASSGSRGSRSYPSNIGYNGESIVRIAEYMLGKPYVFGGTSSSGVDCAGLVTYCYAQIGISVANGSNTIYKSYGWTVSRDDLKPGDVICYDYGGWCGHVAIYIGDGQVIHASASRGVVKYGNLDMMGIIAIKRFI